MQARNAGRHRRPGKRRSQPHPPQGHAKGKPHKGKRKTVQHPVAKRRAGRKPSKLAALRGVLQHRRPSPALAALDRTTDEGLFTSYDETELDGARQQGGAYTVPLYKAPDPSVTFTRAEIDAGALKGRGLELMWLKDPIDAWMLHIQGSSLVKL